MPYWELYYHVVWATHKREPLIDNGIEIAMYQYVRYKCKQLNGYLHAINGIEDHVHVIASIPPSVAISAFVGKLKGASSYFVSNEYRREFKWQAGYGVFSLSRRTLNDAMDYVAKQKIHHQNHTTIARLERIEDNDESPLHRS